MAGSAGEVKAALRSRLIARRAALPQAERAIAAARIAQRLGVLAELGGARTVVGYAAFGAEVPVDSFLESLLDRGVGVFLPWVENDLLRIGRIRDLGADVAPGWRGVREPRSATRRAARPDRVDAVIVPGVAFDRSGNRLGYGGGHFDRLLAAVGSGTVAVGVAFAAQLVDELPVEEHDRCVDVVVTEAGVHRRRDVVPQ